MRRPSRRWCVREQQLGRPQARIVGRFWTAWGARQAAKQYAQAFCNNSGEVSAGRAAWVGQATPSGFVRAALPRIGPVRLPPVTLYYPERIETGES